MNFFGFGDFTEERGDSGQENLEGFNLDVLRSAEEIAKFTVDENLPELDRAALFLDGAPVQRLSVVCNLHYLVKQFGSDALAKIVPRICDLLPRLEAEIQALAAKSFRRLIEENLVRGEMVVSRLLDPALKVLEGKSEVAVEAWLDTLGLAIELGVVPVDVLRAKVCPFAVRKGNVTEPVLSRLMCCKLLGMLAPRLTAKDIEVQFFNKAMTLCQDTEYEVRVCMCDQLCRIAHGVGPQLAKEVLFPELVELLKDEELAVRVQAFEAAVDLAGVLVGGAAGNPLVAQIVPLLLRFCSDRPPELVETIAKSLGRILSSLTPVLTDAQRSELHAVYLSLAADKGPKGALLRRWCAYNFPAVLQSMTASRFVLDLRPTFLALCADQSVAVRQCMAAGFHEVCRLLGTERTAKAIKDTFISFLKDDTEVGSELVPNLKTTLAFFIDPIGLAASPSSSSLTGPSAALRVPDSSTSSSSSKTGVRRLSVAESAAAAASGNSSSSSSSSSGRSSLPDILAALLQFDAALRKNWRRELALLVQFHCLPTFFSSEHICDHVMPVVLRALQDSPYPVKNEASRLAAAFIRRNKYAAQRAELCTLLIASFWGSAHYRDRLQFLEVCEVVAETFSRTFFKAHFFDVVLEAAQDPVPNVRRKLCLMLFGLKKMLGPQDAALSERLKDRTALLMTDSDPEVNRLAVAAAKELNRVQPTRRSTIISRADSNDGGKPMDEEAADRLKEEEEDRMLKEEEEEAEETKKRMEAMADKARHEYKQKIADKDFQKILSSTNDKTGRAMGRKASIAVSSIVQTPAGAAAGAASSASSSSSSGSAASNGTAAAAAAATSAAPSSSLPPRPTPRSSAASTPSSLSSSASSSAAKSTAVSSTSRPAPLSVSSSSSSSTTPRSSGITSASPKTTPITTTPKAISSSSPRAATITSSSSSSSSAAGSISKTTTTATPTSSRTVAPASASKGKGK